MRTYYFTFYVIDGKMFSHQPGLTDEEKTRDAIKTQNKKLKSYSNQCGFDVETAMIIFLVFILVLVTRL